MTTPEPITPRGIRRSPRKVLHPIDLLNVLAPRADVLTLETRAALGVLAEQVGREAPTLTAQA